MTNPTTITHNPTTITHNPTTITHNPTTITHDPTTITHNPTTFTHNDNLKLAKYTREKILQNEQKVKPRQKVKTQNNFL
jgi:hypothetical protein